jgi:F-type H+-transporting ATPase subunit b
MLWLLLALAFANGFSATARAASKSDETQAELTAEEEQKAGHQSGLTRYDLGIWTLVVFGLLLFLLTMFAWKPIMAGLQKREDNIAAHHAAAEKAKADAEKLLEEIKAQRAKTGQEIGALLAEARRDAEAYREAEKARAATEVQAERDRLKREIETARDQALSEIWNKTVELATLVSSKAIGRAVSSDDHRRLVDESLAELSKTIGGSQA